MITTTIKKIVIKYLSNREPLIFYFIYERVVIAFASERMVCLVLWPLAGTEDHIQHRVLGQVRPTVLFVRPYGRKVLFLPIPHRATDNP